MLPNGKLSPGTLHICVDMQNIFAEDTGWHTPWMPRVLPRVRDLARAHAAQTIFTRFNPARNPEAAHGTWRLYYRKWSGLTLDRVAPGLIDLVPDLAALAPPARVIDKTTYSPWMDAALENALRAYAADTLVISGAETDVCVLATVLGAVDRGYRVVIPADALCSSSDEMHDALLSLYKGRYALQIEVATTDEILADWPVQSSSQARA